MSNVITIRDKARAVAQMYEDIEVLFAESQLISAAMRDTHADYTARMTKYSAQQATALDKIGALQDAAEKIMRTPADTYSK
jgi:hypothetical protein